MILKLVDTKQPIMLCLITCSVLLQLCMSIYNLSGNVLLQKSLKQARFLTFQILIKSKSCLDKCSMVSHIICVLNVYVSVYMLSECVYVCVRERCWCVCMDADHTHCTAQWLFTRWFHSRPQSLLLAIELMPHFKWLTRVIGRWSRC